MERRRTGSKGSRKEGCRIVRSKGSVGWRGEGRLVEDGKDGEEKEG